MLSIDFIVCFNIAGSLHNKVPSVSFVSLLDKMQNACDGKLPPFTSTVKTNETKLQVPA